MNKLIVIATLMVASACVYAAPAATAKPAKEMKQYGPYTLDAATDDYQIFATGVMELDDGLGTLTSTILKPNGKIKTSGASIIPLGWVADGTAKWALGDATTTIVGFKNKNVYVKYVFIAGPDAGKTRFYSYLVGTSTKPCKVLGSTSNITNANLVQESSDGIGLWIESAKDWPGNTEGIRVKKYGKKLNGTLAKPLNALTYTTTTGAGTVVLPTAKDNYKYTNTVTAGVVNIYR